MRIATRPRSQRSAAAAAVIGFVLASCGGGSPDAAPTTTAAAPSSTTSTTSPEQLAAVQDLVDGGIEPTVAVCVIETLNTADLEGVDLAAPDDRTEALIAAVITDCEEASRPLDADETRQVLVDTLANTAGLTPEQAECAVAAVEAQGTTAAELVGDPNRLGELLGQVLPGCVEG